MKKASSFDETVWKVKYINRVLVSFMLEKTTKSSTHYHYPAHPYIRQELPTMHLPLYLLMLFTASAVHVPLQPRVGACDAAIQDNEGDELTAPTSDGTAGIGAEFESPFFYLTNSACSKADTDTAKRQVIAGRTGTNFELTADTVGAAGKLQAEYILDGQNIKVGTGDAAKAGAAAAADIVSTRLAFLFIPVILTLLDFLAALEWGRHKQYRRCE